MGRDEEDQGRRDRDVETVETKQKRKRRDREQDIERQRGSEESGSGREKQRCYVRRGNMEAKKEQRQMRRAMGKTEQGHRVMKKYKEGWRGTERGIERDMEG
jgi:hypothetical protein